MSAAAHPVVPCQLARGATLLPRGPHPWAPHHPCGLPMHPLPSPSTPCPARRTGRGRGVSRRKGVFLSLGSLEAATCHVLIHYCILCGAVTQSAGPRSGALCGSVR